MGQGEPSAGGAAQKWPQLVLWHPAPPGRGVKHSSSRRSWIPFPREESEKGPKTFTWRIPACPEGEGSVRSGVCWRLSCRWRAHPTFRSSPELGRPRPFLPHLWLLLIHDRKTALGALAEAPKPRNSAAVSALPPPAAHPLPCASSSSRGPPKPCPGPWSTSASSPS